MSEENTLVIVAGYQDLDAAQHDFENLTGRANAKTLPLQGAVLVGKDNEGKIDTGNRLGRRGAAWGGRRGAGGRPLLAGAAGVDGGGCGGRRAGGHLHPAPGQERPGRQDRAGVVGGQRGGHRRDAGAGPVAGGADVVGLADEIGCRIEPVDDAEPGCGAAGSDGQVQSGPHQTADPAAQLRWHHRPHHGGVGRRLDDRRGRQRPRRCTQRAHRAHRRRRIRGTGYLRRRHQNSDAVAGGEQWSGLQPLSSHRDLLADSCRATDRPQPSPGRLWIGVRVARPLPRLFDGQAAQLRSATAYPARQRLCDRRFR